jgi:hypothetical protein
VSEFHLKLPFAFFTGKMVFLELANGMKRSHIEKKCTKFFRR